MNRSQKIMLTIFIAVLVLLVYAEATKPEPINWFPSYEKRDKIPLGGYVLHNLMKKEFSSLLKETDLPPFEFLNDTTLRGNYFFVNDHIEFDKAESKVLFKWASNGNNIFISARHFSKQFLDSLKIKIATETELTQIRSEPVVQLSNKNISKNKIYPIQQNFQLRHFSKIDTVNQTVLGTSGIYQADVDQKTPFINFLKIPIEKGFIYLHSQPEVFTNFFLLSNDNAQYTAAALSYINNGEHIYWDNYYKSGKKLNTSPLKALLHNKYFRWAYNFLLIGIFFYIVFEGKRRQRIIPIIAPLTNKSYEYIRTVAGMYWDKKAYNAVAHKQITLFLEYIRTNLRISTEKMDSAFIKAVAERSGNTFTDTEELFTFINNLDTNQHITQDQLRELYERIERFKTADA